MMANLFKVKNHRRMSSEKCEVMEEPVIKQESPDHETGSLDAAASTVKTESDDVEDVYPPVEVHIVKDEMKFVPTVAWPWPPDGKAGTLDAASTVETKPDGIYLSVEVPTIKEEMKLVPTVSWPLDINTGTLDAMSTVKIEPADADNQYMQRPYKLETTEDTSAGRSYSMEEHNYCKSDTSYSTFSDQVNETAVSMDHNYSRLQHGTADRSPKTAPQSFEKYEGMEEPVIKQESPDDDASLLDATASTVKMESDEAADVYSLEEETVVKEEMQIGPTVIQPPDIQYMLLPCKLNPAEDTRAGPSCSVEQHNYSESDTSYSTVSDQVHVRAASMDHKYSRPYHCDICNRNFKCSTKLKAHIRAHTDERLYACEICDKRFISRDDLKKHMISHDERPYQCEICNRGFKSSSKLKVHLRIYTPYNCKICNKSFKIRFELKQHMMSHKDEQPYNCEICNRGFKYTSALKQHMRWHTDERPYNCEICNKGCKRRSDLKKHMLCHTEERPYNCEICNKGFKSKYDLKQHMRSHTDERPYNCEICNKRFKSTKGLKQHKVLRCTTL